MADEEQKFCVTIRVPEVDIIIIMRMNEEHLNLATKNDIMSWIFNNGGCCISINKDLLESFTVELVQ